jgi:beta-lactam-binding protein with PASTA domain
MGQANAVYGGDEFGDPDSTMMGGGRAIQIPETRGLTYDQAKQLLEASGLSTQNGGATDSELPVGKVVITDPSVGTEVNGAALITIYTSNGTLVAGPPTQVGKTEAQAIAALSRWNTRVVYLNAPSDICRPVDSGGSTPVPSGSPTPVPSVTCVPAPNPNKGKVVKQTPVGGYVKSTVTVTLTVQK